jgi:NitT/TauT family transport system substrate-binding protein
MHRREVLAAMGLAAAGAAAPGLARAQAKPLRKVTFVFPVGAMPSRYAPWIVAQDLGFFAEEGLDVQFLNSAGGLMAIQQVASGQAELALSPSDGLIAIRGKGTPVRYFYNWQTHVIFSIGVPAESPVRAVADLKGKQIGVQGMGSAAVPYAKAVVRSAGLDPASDVNLIAVGIAAQAAAAIQQKRVDALALWDTEYASMELLGLKFRFFNHPGLQNLPGGGLLARDDYIQASPDVIRGFGRAFARGNVFCFENPEAAVKVYWKNYPQARPRGKDEAAAVREAVHVFRAAIKNLTRDDKADKRWGHFAEAEVQQYIDFLLAEKVIEARLSARDVYTNDFVDHFNSFDAAKVRERARSYR